VDEPDAFEKTRLILARARRQGQPFEEIWPKAVDAAAPAIDWQRHRTYAVRDREAERAALLAAEESWRAGYERRECQGRLKSHPLSPVEKSPPRRSVGLLSASVGVGGGAPSGVEPGFRLFWRADLRNEGL
jgi:hypothetical protein